MGRTRGVESSIHVLILRLQLICLIFRWWFVWIACTDRQYECVVLVSSVSATVPYPFSLFSSYRRPRRTSATSTNTWSSWWVGGGWLTEGWRINIDWYAKCQDITCTWKMLLSVISDVFGFEGWYICMYVTMLLPYTWLLLYMHHLFEFLIQTCFRQKWI